MFVTIFWWKIRRQKLTASSASKFFNEIGSDLLFGNNGILALQHDIQMDMLIRNDSSSAYFGSTIMASRTGNLRQFDESKIYG